MSSLGQGPVCVQRPAPRSPDADGGAPGCSNTNSPLWSTERGSWEGVVRQAACPGGKICCVTVHPAGPGQRPPVRLDLVRERPDTCSRPTWTGLKEWLQLLSFRKPHTGCVCWPGTLDAGGAHPFSPLCLLPRARRSSRAFPPRRDCVAAISSGLPLLSPAASRRPCNNKPGQ